MALARQLQLRDGDTDEVRNRVWQLPRQTLIAALGGAVPFAAAVAKAAAKAKAVGKAVAKPVAKGCCQGQGCWPRARGWKR